MSDGFILATSSEGLQALGSAAQRSFELVVGTVRAQGGEAASAIFAEPIQTERGATVEWYAPMPGRVTPLPRLDPADRMGVEALLASHVATIRGLADTIAVRGTPESFWLAEALRNALQVPGPDAVWALRREDGSLVPLIVNWARQGEELRAVRGTLTATVAAGARAAAPATAPPATSQPATSQPATSQPVAPLLAAPLAAPSGVAGWLSALLILGWVALALMLATLVWLMLAPCGLNPLGSTCSAPEVAQHADDKADLLAEIATLTASLEQEAQGCDLAGAPPAAPVPEQEQQEGAIDEGELDRRLAEGGLTGTGDLMISLAWDGRDDLDLLLTCPGGTNVSFRSKDVPACHARLDIDANFPPILAKDDPVENISVTEPLPGPYRILVSRASDQPPHGAVDFVLVIRQKDQPPRQIAATLTNGGASANWSTDLEIPAR